MTKRLDGRVAVVTGGGNGIGRACCERFAEEGAAVVVADLLEEPGRQTVAAVEGVGAKAIFVPIDAASPEDNEAMMAQAVEAFGGVDVLVTAAGISHAEYRSGDRERDAELLAQAAQSFAEPTRRLLDVTLEGFHGVLSVNLTGTFLAVQAAARHMVETGRKGSIVTIASVAAKHPEAGPLPYGVSKAGVWMLTKQAAGALGRAGIRVNAIGPGFIETNMTQIINDIPMVRDQFLTTLPMGRMGTAREVADVAMWLAGDESSYVTGEIIHPDGGFYTD